MLTNYAKCKFLYHHYYHCKLVAKVLTMGGAHLYVAYYTKFITCLNYVKYIYSAFAWFELKFLILPLDNKKS